MKSYSSAVVILALGTCVFASATAPLDARITPGPELDVLRARQDASSSSVLGWVSTSGASKVSDFRTCDFPATLSLSGSYAQCCTASSACNFFTACSGNVLLAASTSVPCEIGKCNTGVIVASVGASAAGGLSNLACWGTEFGGGAFSLVRSVDSSLIAAATPTGSSVSSAKESSTSGVSSTTTTTGSAKTTTTRTSSSLSSGGPVSSSSTSAPNAAAMREIGSGIVGLAAWLAAFV